MMQYQLLIVISILYNHLVICFWYNMLYQYNFCVILIWNWYKYFRKMLYWSGIDTDFLYKCYIDIKLISIFDRNVIFIWNWYSFLIQMLYWYNIDMIFDTNVIFSSCYINFHINLLHFSSEYEKSKKMSNERWLLWNTKSEQHSKKYSMMTHL